MHATNPGSVDDPWIERTRYCDVGRDDLLREGADALDSATPHSALAAFTAARVHELWLPRPAVNEPVHLATVTPGRAGRAMSRTRRPAYVAHRFQLGSDDIVVIDGLRVTSLERTWLDLAGVLSLPDLVAAADSAVRAGASVDSLQTLLDRFPLRPGVARARRALPLIDARSRSRPETHLRVGVRGITRPTFEVNEPVYRSEGGWLAEPDLTLVAAKIALEYQGADHAELRRMRKDLTRWKDLRDDGWLVLPYGPAEVFGRIWQVRAEVRSSVMARAPELVARTRARDGGRSRRRA